MSQPAKGGVLVYAEHENGVIHPVSFELLGKGMEIADRLGVELWSVLLGHRVKRQAEELVYYGADRVFLYDHPTLEVFDVVRYKHVLVKLVRETEPLVFLVGATPLGRSLAPRVAAALNTGLTADCIDLQVDKDGELVQIRPAFTGNILAHIKTRSRPVMATVSPTACRKDMDSLRKAHAMSPVTGGISVRIQPTLVAEVYFIPSTCSS